MLGGLAGPVNLAPLLLVLLALSALASSGCAAHGGPRPGPTAPGTNATAGRPAAARASTAGVSLTGQGPIRAGAAWRVITPDLSSGTPPRMAGFGQGRDATGVHDDLYARALVIEVGEASIALVALDLIGFFHDDVVRIREEIKARHPEVGAGYVMVCSTHTHAGPDLIGLWTPAGVPLDPDYVAHVRSEAADAVAEAWRARRPARLSFVSARLPELVHDSRLPEVIDPTAVLMKADSADGRDTIATLVNFASHPESLGRGNTLLSSDYPGWTRHVLEEEFGGVAIFTSGAIGGLLTPLGVGLTDPVNGEAIPEKSFSLMQAYGDRLARALIAVWRASAEENGKGSSFVDRGTLDVRSSALRVPLDNPRFIRGLTEGRIRPREVGDDGTLKSEEAVVTLRAAGSKEPLARLACVPGEIYPELVLGGIQDPQDPGADFPGTPAERPLGPMLGSRHRLVVSLCNDELGYIIPMSEWDEKPPFAYGRDSPQYGEMNSVGPRVAPLVLRTFEDLLSRP
ncbi:MAG TPA: neutral/alkaline non-lysosomal ceramidase N-terminal domain-containing protein [Candidatus Dormibacteraeota bacterium]|nr:neutral/alkaline non-lysosomal ceramidase N-terminal domain-containing protein [Candidatus Dormibacteraeota bacterium]